MHIIHNTIGVPKITHKSLGENESHFVVGPLPSGYGVTIGNSLRRVMLSSIPGARATGIKIKGVTHEYTTLPGVKDSILDIMLNLKSLVVEKKDSDIEWVHLVKSKAGRVTAADIKTSSGVKILNPDLLITEIDRDGFELNMSIRIEKWVGYMNMEELKKREEDVHVLLLDANFSPVVTVKYEVMNVRFADMTNLDSLELTIKTTGVMSPQDVLRFSGDMLSSYFALFNEAGLQVEGEFIGDIKQIIEREKREVKSELEKETYTPIEIMGLSPRTLNALVNGDILSIEQLIRCTEAKLSSIKGFGKKAMTEVRESLKERELKLLGDD
ncbi:MAG: DNA-directed RNA polymerase subunit alpha [uncultured bacterium (gcode 4)]|uniref:DNA-directed RNA polymerase subunit alpha n=1 Tax=uncultured bacterium (gcode 4) TaxID=1234023 RepID=K1YVV5_9BACT|nr:MAG: DNA-directed RNA polymerase subunit alpha [uncultured bacterium (gcode 4)]